MAWTWSRADLVSADQVTARRQLRTDRVALHFVAQKFDNAVTLLPQT